MTDKHTNYLVLACFGLLLLSNQVPATVFALKHLIRREGEALDIWIPEISSHLSLQRNPNPTANLNLYFKTQVGSSSTSYGGHKIGLEALDHYNSI